MKLSLIHNPRAGMREPSKKVLVGLLEDMGFKVTYHDIKQSDVEPDLLTAADLVVVAGGDGTVAKIAKKLLEITEGAVPFGILPLGTSNNIAHSLGIDGEIEVIVPAWKSDPNGKLSVGIVKAHWGEQLFVEGVGLGSLACSTSPKKAKAERDERIKQGRIAFRAAIVDTVPERLYVTIDGKVLEEEVLLVEVMNIRQVGPRLRLAPKADAGDRLLDVAYIPADQRMKFLGWLDALIEHGADEDTAPQPPVPVVSGEKIVVAWNGIAIRVDDKFPLMPGHLQDADPAARSKDHADMLSIEIGERQLPIFVPPKATAPDGAPDGAPAKEES